MSAGHFATTVLLAGADSEALNALRPAADILQSFGVGSVAVVLPTGETAPGPDGDFAAVIVASPDAALPSRLAGVTVLPVIRVPTAAGERGGLFLLDDGSGDLPAGVIGEEFATMAIGEAGARNAALFVVSMLAGRDERLRAELAAFRARQTHAVLQHPPLNLAD